MLGKCAGDRLPAPRLPRAGLKMSAACQPPNSASSASPRHPGGSACPRWQSIKSISQKQQNLFARPLPWYRGERGGTRRTTPYNALRRVLRGLRGLCAEASVAAPCGGQSGSLHPDPAARDASSAGSRWPRRPPPLLNAPCHRDPWGSQTRPAPGDCFATSPKPYAGSCRLA